MGCVCIGMPFSDRSLIRKEDFQMNQLIEIMIKPRYDKQIIVCRLSLSIRPHSEKWDQVGFYESSLKQLIML